MYEGYHIITWCILIYGLYSTDKEMVLFFGKRDKEMVYIHNTLVLFIVLKTELLKERKDEEFKVLKLDQDLIRSQSRDDEIIILII